MNTISNERLEKIAAGGGFNFSEVEAISSELLALRKERERAEPFVCPKCGNTGLADSGGVQPWGEPILIECDCTAPHRPRRKSRPLTKLTTMLRTITWAGTPAAPPCLSLAMTILVHGATIRPHLPISPKAK